MATLGGTQHRAGRVSSSMTTWSTASKSFPEATRTKSISFMPSSSSQFNRSNVAGCDSGTVGHGKKTSIEVWDPFQFDCVTPGSGVSSKDLLHAINQQRQSQSCGDAGCRPPYRGRHPPPPARNYCDSGESDASIADNGRHTTEFLYDMWCQQKLCDVVLRCCGNGNTEDTILAHKVHYKQYYREVLTTRISWLHVRYDHQILV